MRGRQRAVVFFALEKALHLCGRDVEPLVAVVQRTDPLGARLSGTLAARHQASSFIIKRSSRWPNSSWIAKTSWNSANAQRPYAPRLLTPGTHMVCNVLAFSCASSP